MFSAGSGVREPSATSLALCLPLYFTANIKFTLIFWCLGGAFRIFLWFESHFALCPLVQTCCSLTQSISSLVASAHLVGIRYPNIYLLDLLTCLIFDCITALARVLYLFARFLNLSQPSMCKRSFSLAWVAQVTGSSAARTDRGSYVFSPVSHSTRTSNLHPFQLGSVGLSGPWWPMRALNLYRSSLMSLSSWL